MCRADRPVKSGTSASTLDQSVSAESPPSRPRRAGSPTERAAAPLTFAMAARLLRHVSPVRRSAARAHTADEEADDQDADGDPIDDEQAKAVRGDVPKQPSDRGVADGEGDDRREQRRPPRHLVPLGPDLSGLEKTRGQDS